MRATSRATEQLYVQWSVILQTSQDQSTLGQAAQSKAFIGQPTQDQGFGKSVCGIALSLYYKALHFFTQIGQVH